MAHEKFRSKQPHTPMHRPHMKHRPSFGTPQPSESPAGGCFLHGELDHRDDVPKDLDLHKGPDETQEFDSVLGSDADVDFTGNMGPRGLSGELVIHSKKIGERKLSLNPPPDMAVKSARKIILKKKDEENKKMERPLSMLVKHIIRMCVHKIITVLYYRHRKVISKHQQEDLRTQLIYQELKRAGKSVPEITVTEKPVPVANKLMSGIRYEKKKEPPPPEAATQDGQEPQVTTATSAETSEQPQPEMVTMSGPKEIRLLEEFPDEVQEAVEKWKKNVNFSELHTKEQYTAIKRLKMELSAASRQIINKQMNKIKQDDYTRDESVDLRLGHIFDVKLKLEARKRQKIEERKKKTKKEEKKKKKREKERDRETELEKPKPKKHVLAFSSTSSGSDSDLDLPKKRPKALPQTPPKESIVDLVPESKVDSEAARKVQKESPLKKMQQEETASKRETPKKEIVKQEDVADQKGTHKEEKMEVEDKEEKLENKDRKETFYVNDKEEKEKVTDDKKNYEMKNKEEKAVVKDSSKSNAAESSDEEMKMPKESHTKEFSEVKSADLKEVEPDNKELNSKDVEVETVQYHEACKQMPKQDWIPDEDFEMGNVTVFLWRHPLVEEMTGEHSCEASTVKYKETPRTVHRLTEDDKSYVSHKQFYVKVTKPRLKPVARKVQRRKSGDNIFQKFSKESFFTTEPGTKVLDNQPEVTIGDVNAVAKSSPAAKKARSRSISRSRSRSQSRGSSRSRSGSRSGSGSRSRSGSRVSSRFGSRNSRSGSGRSSRSGSRSSRSGSRGSSRSGSRSRSRSGSRVSSRSGSRRSSRSGSGSRASSRSGSGSRASSRSRSGSRASSRSGSGSRASSRSGSRSGSGSRSRSRSRASSRSRSGSRASSRSGSRVSSRPNSRSRSRSRSKSSSRPASPTEAEEAKQKSPTKDTKTSDSEKSSGEEILKVSRDVETLNKEIEMTTNPDQSNNSVQEAKIKSPETEIEPIDTKTPDLQDAKDDAKPEVTLDTEMEEIVNQVVNLQEKIVVSNQEDKEETGTAKPDHTGKDKPVAETEESENQKKEVTPEPTLEDDIRDAEISIPAEPEETMDTEETSIVDDDSSDSDSDGKFLKL